MEGLMDINYLEYLEPYK